MISDGWQSYRRLHDEGYNHLTVNRRVCFVDPLTGANTQNLERLWGVWKATVWRLKVRPHQTRWITRVARLT